MLITIDEAIPDNGPLFSNLRRVWTFAGQSVKPADAVSPRSATGFIWLAEALRAACAR